MATIYQVLEYESILESAAAFCHAEPSAKMMRELRPYEDFETIERELSRTKEANLILYEYGDKPISSFDSVKDCLTKVEKGGVLEIAQLLRVKSVLRSGTEFQDGILKYENDERLTELPRIACCIGHADGLVKELSDAIFNEDELCDEASPNLKTLRARIRHIQSKIKDKLHHYTSSSDYANVLRERIVTMRDGRYVLPVRNDSKSMVNGITHDTSDSGATCYVEPLAIIELNNTLRETINEEREEVARILAQLSRSVALNRDVIENNEYYCTLLDFIFARAEYAERTKSVCPIFNENGGLRIERGRHPLLNPASVVPSTVYITDNKRILIISGPNTGGKTVVLKTIGLFCLMTYSGFFLPCESAQIPYYDQVFCDIGDNQSIIESLSTFSSHIRNISSILSQATDRSLVLFDELGAGTDPIEGAALAVSIVEELVSRRVTGAVTTHYSELKEYGLRNDIVENASMEFDPKTLMPTYRVKMGIPGISNALGIASMLGLKKSILERAKNYIGEGKRTFESVLAMADIARTEAENEREKLTLERKKVASELSELHAERERVDEQYEKLSRNAQAEVQRMVEKYTEQAQVIIERMTELEKESNETALLRAKQMRSGLSSIQKPISKQESYQKVDAAELKIGDDVIVVSLGSVAKVKSLSDKQGKLNVAIGNMTVKVSVDDLGKRKFEKQTEPKNERRINRHSAAIATSALMTEVNLLGKTVDESLPLIDELIDRALMQGLPQVKIIHGNGTGALRKGIILHLKKHRNVSEYRQGTYGEGGYGVTIVTVR